MRRVWFCIYIFFLLASACIGYWSMTPGLVGGGFHPTSPFATIGIFAFFFVVSLFSLWYVRHKGAPFRLPSPYRGFPERYREDPLQSLFVCALIALGFLLGSIAGLPGSGAYGRSVIAGHFSFFMAIFVAECLGYFLFRRNGQRV